jgi:hypothetical protein
MMAGIMVTVTIFAAGALRAQTSGPAVNADAATIVDFEKRVDTYVQLRKRIESKVPPLKATSSQEKISHHEHELARAIRMARNNAAQGDIFTPPIAEEIRRLIRIAMQPADGPRIGQSLRHAEPVQLHLRINTRYPERVPLQSTPPSLLANLPKLPMDIEYRVAGEDLVLLDGKANLIIDIIGGVFS